MANEPMTDEWLEACREQVETAQMVRTVWSGAFAYAVPRLIDEIDRMRAALEQEQREHANCEQFHHQGWQVQTQVMVALAEQNAAMRPIVEAVAHGVSDSETGDCGFCGWSGYPHEGNCPVAQAEAFVAAHPAQEGA